MSPTTRSKSNAAVVSDNDTSATQPIQPTKLGGSADSDQQLEFDEREAINPDNIINPKTRSQGPQSGVGKQSLAEVGDEEGFAEGTRDKAMAKSFSQEDPGDRVKEVNKAEGAK